MIMRAHQVARQVARRSHDSIGAFVDARSLVNPQAQRIGLPDPVVCAATGRRRRRPGRDLPAGARPVCRRLSSRSSAARGVARACSSRRDQATSSSNSPRACPRAARPRACSVSTRTTRKNASWFDFEGTFRRVFHALSNPTVTLTRLSCQHPAAAGPLGRRADPQPEAAGDCSRPRAALARFSCRDAHHRTLAASGHRPDRTRKANQRRHRVSELEGSRQRDQVLALANGELRSRHQRLRDQIEREHGVRQLRTHGRPGDE